MALKSTDVADPGPLDEQTPTDTTTKSTAKDAISAGKIRERYEKGTKSIRKEQRDYWINRAFISGEQWIVWNTATQRLEGRAPRDSSRVRLTVNHLRSSTRTIIAKLARRPLQFDVPPSAADDASVRGARIAQTILMDRHREHHWEGLREELALNIWMGGTGFISVDWNPRSGQQLGETAMGRKFGTGDIEETVLSIAEIATEPGVRDIERARWWVKAMALPPAQVQEMFRLPKLPAADASASASPVQYKLLQQDGSEGRIDLTLVIYYYERPTFNSKGQVAVVVGDKVVDSGPWPFPFKDRLNVVAMRESVVPGRWTGETVLSDAISPQTALNMSWSSIVEHMKLAGNARFGIPIGSVENIDSLTDEPGEPIEYAPIQGHRPEYIAPPSMPQWWLEQPDRLGHVIDDVVNVHAISRGDLTMGMARSGFALNLLTAQDETPLGRLAKEMAEGWGRFASLVLEIYADRVKETRPARLQTDGAQRPEVVNWTGKDLADQVRAEVPLDAVQPRSRDAVFQMALQLKQLYPNLDLQTFTTIADLPAQQDLMQTVSPDVDKARRENFEMALGYSSLPDIWDDHAIHINELNRFRKTARYESLDPPVQEIFELHARAHEQLAAEQAARQQALGAVNPALPGVPQADAPEPTPPAGSAPAPGEAPPGMEGPFPAHAPPGAGPGPGPGAGGGGMPPGPHPPTNHPPSSGQMAAANAGIMPHGMG